MCSAEKLKARENNWHISGCVKVSERPTYVKDDSHFQLQLAAASTESSNLNFIQLKATEKKSLRPPLGASIIAVLEDSFVSGDLRPLETTYKSTLEWRDTLSDEASSVQ